MKPPLHPVSRREFLSATLAGGAAVCATSALGRAFASPPAQGTSPKFLVVVNLRGGNDGLNTVVPLQLATYAGRRPGIGILPTAALSLNTGPSPSTDYGLHPSLAQLAARYVLGQVAIANLVGYPNANLSHQESMDVWSRGIRSGTAAPSGWIARFKDLYATGATDVVGLGTGRILDFQGGQSMAMVLASLGAFGFAEDPSFLATTRYRNLVIRRILNLHDRGGVRDEVRNGLELAYVEADRLQAVVRSYTSPVTYPAGGLAARLKDAAMMIKAGFPTRVFYAATGGFDTHSSQGAATGSHAGLLLGVDGALHAFAEDLIAMGAWNRAVILVISEFGRRNDENGSAGTDHGSSSCVLALGGAVRGGVYGRAHTEADLTREHTPYEIDFRSIYKELLATHLGVDPAPVFPEPQERTHQLGMFA